MVKKMSAKTQTRDDELRQLVNQFNTVCSEILNLNVNHGIKWQMKVRVLGVQKQKLLDLVCSIIKRCPVQVQQQVKAEMIDKWNVWLA